MLATLIIPANDGVSQAYPMRMESIKGSPVLFSSHGHIINGSYYQFLREQMNARIETDDLALVAGLLGIPKDDPGLRLIS